MFTHYTMPVHITVAPSYTFAKRLIADKELDVMTREDIESKSEKSYPFAAKSAIFDI